MTARLLDRTGKPLAVPVTAAVRDDADGSRWATAQLALAPLAPADYAIEITVGAGGAWGRWGGWAGGAGWVGWRAAADRGLSGGAMRAAGTALLLLVLAVVTLAQQPPTFRTEANYVRVDVFPTTKDGAPITGSDAGRLRCPRERRSPEDRAVRARRHSRRRPQDTRIDPNNVREIARDARESARARVRDLSRHRSRRRSTDRTGSGSRSSTRSTASSAPTISSA